MVKLRGIELFIIDLINMVVHLGIYVSVELTTGDIQGEVRR